MAKKETGLPVLQVGSASIVGRMGRAERPVLWRGGGWGSAVFTSCIGSRMEGGGLHDKGELGSMGGQLVLFLCSVWPSAAQKPDSSELDQISL